MRDKTSSQLFVWKICQIGDRFVFAVATSVGVVLFCFCCFLRLPWLTTTTTRTCNRSSDFAATAAAVTGADATQGKWKRDIPSAFSRPLANLAMDSCTAVTTTEAPTTNAFLLVERVLANHFKAEF